jgi:hypothetical protein
MDELRHNELEGSVEGSVGKISRNLPGTTEMNFENLHSKTNVAPPEVRKDDPLTQVGTETCSYRGYGY